MSRFKNLFAVAGLTAGMLLGLSTAAHAEDWDRDSRHDRYERREHYRDYDRDYWRDRDGCYYRRVWNPYRGWVVERYYPQPPAWDRHDNGRHLGWYKHEGREWHDRDDD